MVLSTVARRLRGGVFLLAAISTLFACPAGGDTRTPSADEVKAAFLYHFGRFVVWPSSSFPRAGTFAICVLGEHPIAEVLDRTVRDKQVQERRIDIRRARSVKEAQGCQILFIGGADSARLGELMSAVRGASVLTVSDIDDFVDRGGMVSLLLEQNKVRFEVNLRVVEHAGLKMSSQLLKLARRVIAGPSQERTP